MNLKVKLSGKYVKLQNGRHIIDRHDDDIKSSGFIHNNVVRTFKIQNQPLEPIRHSLKIAKRVPGKHSVRKEFFR